MEGTVSENKKLVGTLSSGGSIVGGVGTVYGKDGDSAYQVAVKNGFEGSETEWLASLVGADGKDGIDGKDGTNGTNGKDGTNGIDGEDGADGLTPFINANGYWQIGETNTGIKAAGIDGGKGDKGDTGNSGVYLGSGEMPEDCNVQIDPDGDVITVDQTFNATSTNPQSGVAIAGVTNWELISSETITETVTEYIKDLGGKYKKVAVYMTVPNDTTNAPTTGINLITKYRTNYERTIFGTSGAITKTANPKGISIKAEYMGRWVSTYKYSAQSADKDNGYYVSSSNKFLENVGVLPTEYPLDYLDNVKVRASWGFGVGTKIEIYGVKA